MKKILMNRIITDTGTSDETAEKIYIHLFVLFFGLIQNRRDLVDISLRDTAVNEVTVRNYGIKAPSEMASVPDTNSSYQLTNLDYYRDHLLRIFSYLVVALLAFYLLADQNILPSTQFYLEPL